MARRVNPNVEANFVGGLKTEATGLNFPENAATETYNCIYDKIGNVERRLGFDYETNYSLNTIYAEGQAITTFHWRNAGGDGSTSFLVQQNGGNLYFYKDSSAVAASSVSAQKIATVIAISNFTVVGGTFSSTAEATYAAGNGYLLVFHPSCDTIYCTWDGSTVSASTISLQIRDFVGVNEGIADVNFRPLTLDDLHKYNLTNQGWVTGAPWTATSTSSVTVGTGTKTFTIASGLTIANGTPVKIKNKQSNAFGDLLNMSGTVTSYSGTTLTVSVNQINQQGAGVSWNNWSIEPLNTGFIDTWNTAIGNYPSNADVWQNYKNADDEFDPATTYSNVGLNAGQAPRGHYILSAFNMDRSASSAIPNLTVVSTLARPTVGTWFQGRAWYSGVNASQQATGNANYYSWSENIYFSQIVEDIKQIGMCYQVNDPSAEKLYDLLQTDGGVIHIQGSGPIIKLFPVSNGLLVFGTNGIWFITGNNGQGFTANDYTIVKISDYRALTASSFVDVGGYPMFWNEEAIYYVTPQQGGGMSVEPISLGTIQSFYDDIPLRSKRYAKGVYNPVDFTVQWLYRSVDTDTVDVSVRSVYKYDRVLVFNMYTKAFYPYSLDISDNTTPVIHGINYIPGISGSTGRPSRFLYLCSKYNSGNRSFTFAEEKDETYKDWETPIVGIDYDSYFVCGYKVHGQAQRKFQSNYVYLFFDTSEGGETAYRIQGFWDWANSGESGRYAAIQLGTYEQTVDTSVQHYNVRWKRHKIRGHGLAMQIKVRSVSGKPFKIIGWSIFETQNASV